MGARAEQDVYEGEAQHHLDDHVEHEEPVHQVEQGKQLRHAHASGLHGGEEGVQRSLSRSPGLTLSSTAMKPEDGVGHVEDEGAPPKGRCGGHETEHEARDHLPPSRLLAGPGARP